MTDVSIPLFGMNINYSVANLLRLGVLCSLRTNDAFGDLHKFSIPLAHLFLCLFEISASPHYDTIFFIFFIKVDLI